MTNSEARKRVAEKRGSADQGKGSYVAFATDGYDPTYMRDGNLSLVRDGEEVVHSFERAVEMAEEAVRDGRSHGTVEVVELAVVRRAVVKRAVEVSIS